MNNSRFRSAGRLAGLAAFTAFLLLPALHQAQHRREQTPGWRAASACLSCVARRRPAGRSAFAGEKCRPADGPCAICGALASSQLNLRVRSPLPGCGRPGRGAAILAPGAPRVPSRRLPAARGPPFLPA